MSTGALPADLNRAKSHLEEHIGETTSRELGTIDRRFIRRYARALDDRNPLYDNVDAARAAGYDDVIAPPNMLLAVIDWGPGRWEDELNRDGTADDVGWLGEATRGLRVMGGGEQTFWARPVVAGTTVTMTETVDGVEAKDGASGPFLLVRFRLQFADDEGQPLCESHRTTILRPQDSEKKGCR